MDKLNRVHFSSLSGEWRTPLSIFEFLDKAYNFNLDPCNPPIATKFRRIKNGLLDKWNSKLPKYPEWNYEPVSRAFINPPYYQTERWIGKAWKEIVKRRCSIAVFLLPARTDTNWFDFCVNKKCTFYKIRGRLKFGKAKNPAPFPSIVVVMK